MSEPLAAIVVLALLLGCILVLQRPLLPGRREADVREDELRRADLEAAKVTKYREIRDAELDRRTGKLSDEDWRTIDRRLRDEAIVILRELDELGPGDAPDDPGVSAADVLSASPVVDAGDGAPRRARPLRS